MVLIPHDLVDIANAIRDRNADAAEVNKRITAAYHEISVAIRGLLRAQTQLDWCGFAKWSSNTVGQDLDPNQTGSRIGTIVNDLIEIGIHPVIATAVAVALRKLRDHGETGTAALRAGNAVIFLEMSLVFNKLIERFNDPRRLTRPEEFADDVLNEVFHVAMPEFAAGITSDHLLQADPEALKRGILFYLKAAQDIDHQAELMLAGNVSFSMYEQMRADRLITIGLCAPMRELVLEFLPELLADLLGVAPPDGWRLAPNTGVPDPYGTLDRFTARFLTRRALVVKIAQHVVRLGEPDAVDPAVDPSIETVAVTLGEVSDLLDRLTFPADIDWTDFPYRIAFIRKYFAVYQIRPEAQQRRS